MNYARLKRRSWGVLLTLILCLLFLSNLQAQKNTEIDYASLWEPLKMRAIGPAIMGGRVVDFAVVESDTAIIYVAIGPSGVWKSINNGITWEPVFDQETTVAVGAVEVSQSNPDINRLLNSLNYPVIKYLP